MIPSVGIRTELEARVYAEIAAVLDLLVHDLTPDGDLRANYGIGDHDRQQLRVALDKAFGIFVPLPHAAQWATVGDITRYVETRLAALRVEG